MTLVASHASSIEEIILPAKNKFSIAPSNNPPILDAIGNIISNLSISFVNPDILNKILNKQYSRLITYREITVGVSYY